MTMSIRSAELEAAGLVSELIGMGTPTGEVAGIHRSGWLRREDIDDADPTATGSFAAREVMEAHGRACSRGRVAELPGLLDAVQDLPADGGSDVLVGRHCRLYLISRDGAETCVTLALVGEPARALEVKTSKAEILTTAVGRPVNALAALTILFPREHLGAASVYRRYREVLIGTGWRVRALTDSYRRTGGRAELLHSFDDAALIACLGIDPLFEQPVVALTLDSSVRGPA